MRAATPREPGSRGGRTLEGRQSRRGIQLGMEGGARGLPARRNPPIGPVRSPKPAPKSLTTAPQLRARLRAPLPAAAPAPRAPPTWLRVPASSITWWRRRPLRPPIGVGEAVPPDPALRLQRLCFWVPGSPRRLFPSSGVPRCLGGGEVPPPACG